MVIKDVYYLKRSEVFYLLPRQEAEVNLKLEKVPDSPCSMLYGQVTNHCQPIMDATVKVFGTDFKPLYHTFTEVDGKFIFKNIIPSGKYLIAATANGYAVSANYPVTIKNCKPVQMTIKLKPSFCSKYGVVYGNVRDGFGMVINDVKVSVLDYINQNIAVATTQTNEDGEYLIYRLKPKRYWISAEKEGYTLPQKVLFECIAEKFTLVDLILYDDALQRKGTVSGRIQNNGEAVPDAVVALYKITAYGHELIAVKETNGEGFYLFADVLPGEYLVKAKLENGYELEKKEITE